MEKRLPRISLAVFVVALLLILEPNTDAQVEQTVSIKTLTMGVVYQAAPEPVAGTFWSFRGIHGL